MTLLEKVSFLINENNLNRRKFSLQSGIPYSTIDNWYKVGYEKMQLVTFRSLCDFFGVTMDSMVYDDQPIVYKKDVIPQEFTPEEKDLIYDFRYLDSDGRNRISNSLKYEKEQEREKKKSFASA